MAESSDRSLLRHFLAALAYRTQKSVRGAPAHFATFQAGNFVREPHDIVRHMTSVLGYARTFFLGGDYRAELLPSLDAELDRLHDMLADLSRLLEEGVPLNGITEAQLLQGPFADAMTHAGQLALLRRLSGSPVPPENFIFADIRIERVGREQAEPARPDPVWPERPR